MPKQRFTKTSNHPPSVMEELLSKQEFKPVTITRGGEIEGIVVLISDNEVVLDLGTKSEGVLPKKEIPSSTLSSLKQGDKLKSYVAEIESESGQVVLSQYRSNPTITQGKFSSFWNKFIQAKNQKSIISGNVLEANKGGLIIETGNIKGFLPTSQINLEKLMKAARKESDSLKDQVLEFYVIEVDERNKRLVFSQREDVLEKSIKDRFAQFNSGDKAKGKILAVLPFGLIIDINGTPGIVYISEVSWEKIDDLSKLFKVGEEIESQVFEKDEKLAGLSLSLKRLKEDPFSKLSEKYKPDDTVKGTVSSIQSQGIAVILEDGIEGFISASKLGSNSFHEGQVISLIVDNVDSSRRKINLSPLITSTKGLIYK